MWAKGHHRRFGFFALLLRWFYVESAKKREIRQNLVAGDQGEAVAIRRKGLRERLQESVGRWVGLRYVFETGRQVLYFGVPILFLAWSDATYSVSDLEMGEYMARVTPNVGKTHDDLGRVYVRQGQYERAIEEHQKAVELDPEFAPAYTHLGIAYSLSGDLDRAIELHLKAIDLDPEMAQAHYNLGVDYWRMGEIAEAERAFKRSIEEDRQYIRAYQALSQVYKKQGNRAEYIRISALVRDLAKTAQRRELSRSAMPWATGTALADNTH